ncbi:LuxR family transcriptional regulator [Xanthobacter sp. DSM 24535]|uniref:LuxR family transcriptional activator of conjugal transfer of Ti plasmids n=1 Tax=Aquabacter spiritensis TaxID=933073 RepID=A0A4R3LND9_9HYPH|nr:LuxR family transcriptional regulator [Aquabacter spiritensis]TCT01862.1 LuxR family transcriptional activator of conjugal transfer of Ti plasmids [Aquabacter spiritensis]
MSAAAERFLDDYVPDLIDAMEVAQDAQTIKSALARFADRAGFERFTYAAIRAAESRLFSNYPEEWVQRYLSRNYFAIDPVVVTARRSMLPFAWSGPVMGRANPEVSEIIEEAKAFGRVSGFSIPIRVGFGTMAMLTLASERPTETIAVRDPTHVTTAVALLHLNITRLGSALLNAADITLSPRELTCLKWASMGKTKAETGSMLGITEKTVRFYLEQAREKLHAANIAHAVWIATTRELI